MSRFEIVRTDADQPWHTRLKANNGQIVLHSENYAEHDSAANAVAVAAEAFGITMTRPPELGDPEVDGVGFMGEAPNGQRYCFDVREVDEREADPELEEQP